MKRNTSIKLKAAFLLTVFALNTVVGFACSVGMDMGFNSKHHQDQATKPAVHIHADGKHHVHKEKKESELEEKSHHENNAGKAIVHVHKDGKQHVHNRKKDSHSHDKSYHKDEPAETVIHMHNDGKRIVHGEKKETHSDDNSQSNDQQKIIQESKSDKENCCTDEVRDFEALDKSVPHTLKIVHPIFFTVFLSTYYDIRLLPLEDVVKDIKQFVRSYHPPIPDIRIAIQSFQI